MKSPDRTETHLIGASFGPNTKLCGLAINLLPIDLPIVGEKLLLAVFKLTHNSSSNGEGKRAIMMTDLTL